MAKKKNGSSVSKLAAQLAQLNSKISSQAAKPRPKKKKQRKKSRKGKGSSLRPLSSDFAKAFLDPFSVKGARVPDSELCASITGYTRYLVNKGNPIFNFTQSTVYMNFILAPVYTNSSKPCIAAGTSVFDAGWWDYTGTATIDATIDLTKPWGQTPGNFVQVENNMVTCASRRVSGGGLRFKFYGVPEDTPVDAYYVPVFNGDRSPGSFADAVPKAVAHYVVKGDGSFVVPFPIRNSNNAFNWIDDSRDGFSTNHYPADSGTSKTHAGFVFTAATNNSVTNTDIDAHSLSNGMGAISVTVKLPPGAAISVDGIVHMEGIVSYGVTNNAWSDENIYAMSMQDPAQLAAVSNASSIIAVQDKVVQNGDVTPYSQLQEFQRMITGQALTGMQQAVEDTQVMNRVSYAITAGLIMGGGMSARSYMLGR